MDRIDALINSLQDEFIDRIERLPMAELEAWHKRNFNNNDPELDSFFALLERILIYRGDVMNDQK